MGELDNNEMTLEKQVKIARIKRFFFILAIWGLGLITGITAMSSIKMYSDLTGDKVVLDLR